MPPRRSPSSRKIARSSPTTASSRASCRQPRTADQQAQLAAALKQNKSVLDYVESSVQRMSARVSAAEKVRLQSHLDGLRELEMRFAQMPGGPRPT